MPTITPQARPSSAPNEADYRAPHKSIQAPSTGMSIEKTNPQDPQSNPQPKSGQTHISEETVPKVATLSPQLSALARKEAKFRQEQAKFNQQKAEFAFKNSNLEKVAGLTERLAKKDFSALDEMGLSYKEWGDYLRAKQAGMKPEVQAIKKIEDKLTQLEQNQQQQVSKQYEATVNQYRTDVKALIAKDPEFSTVKELGQEESVVQHILDTFEHDGDILTIEQASKEIEDFLVEEAEKMAGLTKVKSKLQASQQSEKRLPPPRSGRRTLTNELPPANQEVVRGKGQFQHLSPQERIKAALERASKQG